MKKYLFALIVIAVLIGIWKYYLPSRFVMTQPRDPFSIMATSTPEGCSMESKQCPDGSYVDRTGPKCEFKTCRDIEKPDWKTYRSEEYGFTVQYPLAAVVYDVDIGGGRNISFEVSDNGSLMVSVVNESWHNGVLRSPADCNDFDSKTTTSHESINGIEFVKGDVSSQFNGMQTASDAIEYCTMNGDIAYKIILREIFGRGQARSAVEENAVLNRMVSSFKFTSVTDRQSGEIKKIYQKNGQYYIDIDYISIEGPKQDPRCNPVCVKNVNPLIRTFPIDNNAIVNVYMPFPDLINTDMTKLKELFDNNKLITPYFDVYILNGQINKIEHVYIS